MAELTQSEVKRLARRPRGTTLDFPAMCKLHGLPEPIPEYVFARPRRWRFDFAWINGRVALEIQGGIFTHGRHTRGAALLREHEKLNAAARLGWRVIYCVPKDVKSGAIFETLRAVLA